MVICCVVGCKKHAGPFECFAKQAKVATALYDNPRNTSSSSMTFDSRGEKEMFLCATCTIRVAEAHLAPLYRQCTSREGSMKPREFLSNICKIAKKCVVDVNDEADSKRRVSKEVESINVATNAPTALDDDLLDWCWLNARPLIPRRCFIRSFIITVCRVLLIMSHHSGFGRSAFDGNVEGEDVLRFSLMIYAAYAASLFDVFRGSSFFVPLESQLGLPTPEGEPWDVRDKNLVGFPSQRTMRRYIGTPLSLKAVLTVSSEAVNKVISVLMMSAMISTAVAITFDKVCYDCRLSQCFRGLPGSLLIRAFMRPISRGGGGGGPLYPENDRSP